MNYPFYSIMFALLTMLALHYSEAARLNVRIAQLFDMGLAACNWRIFQVMWLTIALVLFSTTLYLLLSYSGFML